MRTASAGLACLILVIWTNTSRAQVHPSLAVRQSVVNALNAALSPPGQPGQIASVELQDFIAGECVTVAPLNVTFIHNATEGYFTLRTLYSPAGTLTPPFEHALVSDLNNWLNTVWAFNLRALDEFEELPYSCSNNGQRFVAESTTDADLVAALKEATGENGMLARYYDINGTIVQGSSLLSFAPAGTRAVKFITDLGTGDPSTRQRLLSGAYLRVTCPNGGPQLTIKVELNLEQYSSDCGTTEAGSIPRFRVAVNDVWPCGSMPSTSGDVNANNLDAVNSYKAADNLWVDKHDYNGSDIVPENGGFTINASGQLKFWHFHNQNYCWAGQVTLCQIQSTADSAQYCEVSYCYDGAFVLDEFNQLVYRDNPTSNCAWCLYDPDHAVPCIEFCDSIFPQMPTMSGVLKTDAQKFADDLPLVDASEFAVYTPPSGANLYANQNLFQKGARGKWRSHSSFAYRVPINPGSGLFASNANSANERAYNDAGVFDLTLFSWGSIANDQTKWLNTARVTRYSPNGEPVEEEDIFGVPSAAHFGYLEQVPILVAKNSTYLGVHFDSFEGDVVENSGLTNDFAHSGHWSYRLPENDWSNPIVKSFTIDQRTADDGLLVRFWEKHTYPAGNPTQYDENSPVSISFHQGTTANAFSGTSISLIARSGEWSLYEIDASNLAMGTYDVKVQNTVPSIDSWIDDLRIQPMKSEMVCYVYDAATLRLITSFDDQHFGVFFQYNGEGKLVRKMIETMRGTKTVQENQYHTPLTVRVETNPPGGGAMLDTDPAGSAIVNGFDLGSANADALDIDPTPATFQTDLLDLDIGLGKSDVKVLGLDPRDAADRVSELSEILRSAALDSLHLPQLEKLKLINELEAIDNQLDKLIDASHDVSIDERDSMKEAIQQATSRRAQLMQKLGVSEADARELINRVRELRRTGNADEHDAVPNEQSPDE